MEDGSVSTYAPSPGISGYAITVQACVIKIGGRVIAPTDTDDSCRARIPGATIQTMNHPNGWVR